MNAFLLQTDPQTIFSANHTTDVDDARYTTSNIRPTAITSEDVIKLGKDHFARDQSRALL